MEFEFGLAKDLGWRSVDQMRRGMSNREYVQWIAWYTRKAEREKAALDKATEKASQKQAEVRRWWTR